MQGLRKASVSRYVRIDHLLLKFRNAHQDFILFLVETLNRPMNVPKDLIFFLFATQIIVVGGFDTAYAAARFVPKEL